MPMKGFLLAFLTLCLIFTVWVGVIVAVLEQYPLVSASMSAIAAGFIGWYFGRTW